MTRTALIAGAQGIIGKALTGHLLGQPAWHVRGLGRRGALEGESLHCDLLDPDAVTLALKAATDTTHLFYCALSACKDLADEVEVNGAMLSNLLDALKDVGAPLKRVVLYQGAKVYGIHLGKVPSPFYEDDNPPHLGPNFYRVQEAELRKRSRRGDFEFAILRPDLVIGDTAINAMNIATVIGAYAAICRATGAAFRFPGSEQVYRDVLAQMSDAVALARASIWAAEAPEAAGEAFNYVHEPFRWKRLWTHLASELRLPLGPPQPMRLTEQMAYHAQVWDRIRAEQGLAPLPLERAVRWDFADFVFGCNFDVLSDMAKIRRAGFTQTVDTGAALLAAIARQRASGVLPR